MSENLDLPAKEIFLLLIPHLGAVFITVKTTFSAWVDKVDTGGFHLKIDFIVKNH